MEFSCRVDAATAATFATAVAALAGSGGLLFRKNVVSRHSRNLSHVKATA